jgi:hypothetical protein
VTALVVQYLVRPTPEEWVTLDTVTTEGAMRRMIVEHVRLGFVHAHRVMDGHDVPAWFAHLDLQATPPELQFSRRNHPPVSLDTSDLVAPGLLDAPECPDCGFGLVWGGEIERRGQLWCRVCRRYHALPEQGRA